VVKVAQRAAAALGGNRLPRLAACSDSAQLEERSRARQQRDFATSDRPRDELAAMGVPVIDTRAGQKWDLSRR